MYSAHGWATIWPSFKNDDSFDDLLEQERMDAQRDQIAAHIQQVGLEHTAEQGNPFAELRTLNNETHLWLSGNTNHATEHEAIVELFHYIAEVAPGAYGLLYTMNDEDAAHPNHFCVWVLARGALVERGDPFLSPYVPTVEDVASDSKAAVSPQLCESLSRFGPASSLPSRLQSATSGVSHESAHRSTG